MRRVISLVGAVLFLAACQPSFGVYDLRCEGLKEPLGIDGTEPHFSWKIRSDKPMEQAAFEIEVGPGLWQSGKVESSEQVMVPYGGAPLAARQQAWWRVRVWDTAGKASAWSRKSVRLEPEATLRNRRTGRPQRRFYRRGSGGGKAAGVSEGVFGRQGRGGHSARHFPRLP